MIVIQRYVVCVSSSSQKWSPKTWFFTSVVITKKIARRMKTKTEKMIQKEDVRSPRSITIQENRMRGSSRACRGKKHWPAFEVVFEKRRATNSANASRSSEIVILFVMRQKRSSPLFTSSPVRVVIILHYPSHLIPSWSLITCTAILRITSPAFSVVRKEILFKINATHRWRWGKKVHFLGRLHVLTTHHTHVVK